MIGIIVIGLVLIWIYKYAKRYQQNAGVWVVMTIIAYLFGYYGFKIIANTWFAFLLDQEWESLAYPMFSGWFCVGFILLLLRLSRKSITSENDDSILD